MAVLAGRKRGGKITVKWLIIPAFWFLYWGICFLCTGTDKKNLAGLRSYPDAVQDIVCEKLGGRAPKEKSMSATLLSNLVLFTAVFCVIGLIFREILAFGGYLPAFRYFLILGEGLGLFDFLIIDLLWWRNTRRIRFSFLPDKLYYKYFSKHLGSFVRGIPLFAGIAALSAWIVTVI